jgi:hypothetical protein
MTRLILVDAFMEGASMETLAKLLGEELDDLQAGLRQGLHEFRDQFQPEVAGPQAESAGATAPRTVRTEAADSSPRPVRRKKAAAKAFTDTVNDFSGYPEEIRHHLNETGRAIYDALRTKPQNVIEIARSTGFESNAVAMGLRRLRDKNLVRGSEDTPVVWRLA